MQIQLPTICGKYDSFSISNSTQKSIRECKVSRLNVDFRLSKHVIFDHNFNINYFSQFNFSKFLNLNFRFVNGFDVNVSDHPKTGSFQVKFTTFYFQEPEFVFFSNKYSLISCTNFPVRPRLLFYDVCPFAFFNWYLDNIIFMA